MLPRLTLASVAIALTVARPGYADPVADFKTGKAVVVRTMTVKLDALWSAAALAMAKAAGSLDLTLQLADLGIPARGTLHLRGSSLGGERITYTVDDSYSPAIDLGDGHRLSRVAGRVNAVASWLPGAARPEVGNVNLSLVDDTGYVVLQIDGNTHTIPIITLDVSGGVVPPPLESFVDTGNRLACSDVAKTAHSFVVSLTDTARDNGAPVMLKSPLRGGARLPPAILVPAGRRSATVTAVVEPNFVGTVHLTAAAGGVARSLDLAIHAHRDCPATREQR